MRLSPFLVVALGLIACLSDAQGADTRKPPFLRCVPLYIERPFEATDTSSATTETVITMGSPGDPVYFVRVDTRSSNQWRSADNVVYQQEVIVITDETVITVGSPGDPVYTVRTETAISTRFQEAITFPNRTYIIAGTSSYSTNGVMAESDFKATRYCYGVKRGTTLTKAQYDRLKTWMGID